MALGNISDLVHEMSEDLIQIKARQNSQSDSALVYRLDIDMRPYLSSSTTIFAIRVMPTKNVDPSKTIVMPVAYSNSPPTLVPQSLNAGQHPSDPYKIYYRLFRQNSSYPKFDTYGAHVTIYSNVQLELVSIEQI